MILISRTQWGARSPDYRNVASLSEPSTGHWNGPTVTVGGQLVWDHSKCASLIRGIQNFHMDTQGWSDIAYNFLVCPHGYAFEGRGLNVINGANGTNVGNQTSHAICFLAGEENPFPEIEKQAFKELVRYISAHTNAPDQCVGHRDHKSTACPGDERYVWIHQGMPVTETPIGSEDEDMQMLISIDKYPEVWLLEATRYTHMINDSDLARVQAALGGLPVAEVSEAQFNLLRYGRTQVGG